MGSAISGMTEGKPVREWRFSMAKVPYLNTPSSPRFTTQAPTKRRGRPADERALSHVRANTQSARRHTDEKENVFGFPPGIKHQGKKEHYRVFHPDPSGQHIKEQVQGKESVKEKQAGKDHVRTSHQSYN